MEKNYENDEGLNLFYSVMIKEENTRIGVDQLTKIQYDILGIRCDNIVEIALGKDYKTMNYMTDEVEKTNEPNTERRKIIFETTSKKEIEKITLLKNYFETKDIKPLQDYWDNIFDK